MMIPGMSVTERIRNFWKIKRVKVIVGIVDSGVDIEHEDLKSVFGPTQKKLRVTV
jgi:hypothetical protein